MSSRDSRLWSLSTAERCMCHYEGRKGCPLHMDAKDRKPKRTDHPWRKMKKGEK